MEFKCTAHFLKKKKEEREMKAFRLNFVFIYFSDFNSVLPVYC
jgi:hypothetical protein